MQLLGQEESAAVLEAALSRVYGIDLVDFYRGRLSLRRLCVLVAGLPADAWHWPELHGQPAWTRTEGLLLAVERRVTALWATLTRLAGGSLSTEDTAPPITPPEPVRPAHRAEKTLSLREIAGWVNGT